MLAVFQVAVLINMTSESVREKDYIGTELSFQNRLAVSIFAQVGCLYQTTRSLGALRALTSS